jgi:hypothetical protein
VGVYVDAFNLYYGARDHCGRGTAGWRWLDVVGLAEDLTAERRNWHRPEVVRMVYCTATRAKDDDPTSEADQYTYIMALQSDSRVHVEFGQYNPKYGRGVLTRVVPGRKRGYERIASPGPANFPPGYPFGEVRGAEGQRHISITYASFEEKGSDVNLATHLINDTLNKRIDAAVVISNDGDLRFPLELARQHIPVGLVNPSRRPTSEMLRGESTEGVGRHWWLKLSHDHYRAHQFSSETIAGNVKPTGW